MTLYQPGTYQEAGDGYEADGSEEVLAAASIRVIGIVLGHNEDDARQAYEESISRAEQDQADRIEAGGSRYHDPAHASMVNAQEAFRDMFLGPQPQLAPKHFLELLGHLTLVNAGVAMHQRMVAALAVAWLNPESLAAVSAAAEALTDHARELRQASGFDGGMAI